MKYFKPHEFKCKCKCGGGFNDMDITLVHQLDLARDYAGIPFVINSAYRCVEHNRKVGGSATSSHLYGYAIDIRAKNIRQKNKIIGALKRAGFYRIGVSRRFIHVDNDPNKQPACWKY